jgi:hypothetical protein
MERDEWEWERCASCRCQPLGGGCERQRGHCQLQCAFALSTPAEELRCKSEEPSCVTGTGVDTPSYSKIPSHSLSCISPPPAAGLYFTHPRECAYACSWVSRAHIRIPHLHHIHLSRLLLRRRRRRSFSHYIAPRSPSTQQLAWARTRAAGHLHLR